MTWVSFVKSTARISTIGLSCDERVQARRAHQERRHDLAAVALLGRAGDDAGLDQVDDRVGEHLGVDPEVALVGQRHRGRRRDRTDPELERRPVRDELRHVLADPPLDVADQPGSAWT